MFSFGEIDDQSLILYQQRELLRGSPLQVHRVKNLQVDRPGVNCYGAYSCSGGALYCFARVWAPHITKEDARLLLDLARAANPQFVETED